MDELGPEKFKALNHFVHKMNDPQSTGNLKRGEHLTLFNDTNTLSPVTLVITITVNRDLTNGLSRL